MVNEAQGRNGSKARSVLFCNRGNQKCIVEKTAKSSCSEEKCLSAVLALMLLSISFSFVK